MSINEEAVAVVQNAAIPMDRDHAELIVHYLSVGGLLAPAPQIIRTVKELKALDEDSVVLSPHRDDPTVVLHFIEEIDYDPGYADDLPAVVVASGEHVRACREALEGETT